MHGKELQGEKRARSNSSKSQSFLRTGQTLLANIAHVLIKNADFREKINLILHYTGEAINVSRVYIFEDDLILQETNNTFEWCGEGIEPQIDILQGIPMSAVSEWYEIIGKTGYINVDNISLLSESVQQILAPQGIISIVIFKLSLPNGGTGFVGFDECLKERHWTQYELDVLISITGIITSLYENDYLQNKLKSNELNFKNMFNSITDYIIVADLDGYFLQVNNAVRERTVYDDIEQKKGKVHILDLHPVEYHQTAQQVLKDIMEGKLKTCTIPLISKHNYEIPVETAIWFGDWDGKEVLLGFSKDLTAETEALDMFNKLFESNPLPIVVVNNLTYDFTKVNRAFLQMFEFEESEVIGKTAEKLGIFNDSTYIENIDKVLKNGQSLIWHTVSTKTKKGRILEGVLSGSMILSGDKQQFMAVFTDLTEQIELQKRLEDKNERLEHILESTELGTWEWDWETGKTVFNDNWAHMLGYSLKELGDTNISTWFDRVHPDDKAHAKIEMDSYLDGKTPYYVFEHRLLHKNGDYIWVRDTGKIVEYDDSGKPKLMFGSHLDITKIKVSELNLLEAKKRAEEANTAKSNFLTMVSHEIRTPVHILQGITELLSKTNMSKKQKGYTLRLIQSSNNLLETVNNVLDFSKMEIQKPVLQEAPFFLHELLENMQNVFAFRFAQKNLDLVINIDPDVPLHLFGDAFRIKQILQNLLSNAEKYTSEGCVTLQVRLLHIHQNCGHVEFSVIDTGFGMGKEIISKLFIPYFQGTEAQSKTKYAGSGLGLPIVKQLVELLSGEIFVTSQQGKGSIFKVVIPFKVISQYTIRNYFLKRKHRYPNVLYVQRTLLTESLINSLISLGFIVHEIDQSMLLPEDNNSGETVLIMEWDNTLLKREGNILSSNSWKQKFSSALHVVLTPVLTSEAEVSRVFAPLLFSILKTPVSLWTLLQTIEAKFGFAGEKLSRVEGYSDFKHGSLLVCDDNIINLEMIQELLEVGGYVVEVVTSGEMAIQRIQNKRFDLLLLDLQMPGIDGFETTKIIRTKLHNMMPIIAFSAHALPVYEQKCFQIGMNGYLVKPISSQQLLKAVDYWVNRGLRKSGKVSTNMLSEDVKEIVDSLESQIEQEFKVRFQAVMDRYSYNIKTYKRHLDSHISELETYEKDLERKIFDNDSLKRGLHALRGVSSNMGMMNFSEVLWSYETSLESHNTDREENNQISLGVKIKRHIKNLKEFSSFLIEHFPDVLKQGEMMKVQKKETDIIRLCDELKKALAIGDVDASINFSCSLLSIANMQDTAKKQVKMISNYIEVYDFSSADRLLDSLYPLLSKNTK